METLNLQTIYCQGAKGAYSHIAAGKITRAEAKFVRTFEEVFASVSACGGSCAGIVPVENSTAGAVGEVMSLLVQYDLYIGFAINLKIDHNLCARGVSKLSDIKKIYSHHQALMQCSKFLQTVQAECIETVNTATSAMLAAQEGEGSAAICSQSAANLYGLNIISGDICNDKNNQTRFAVVMTRENYQKLQSISDCGIDAPYFSEVDRQNYAANKDFSAEKKGAIRKNSAVYFEIENISGSLRASLDIFSRMGINLISIHSLPIKGKAWSYGFYAETDKLEPERILSAMDELKKSLQQVKLLGIYTAINA